MNIEDRILYEDNHIIAINKLPGEIVQGDKTEDSPLSDFVKLYLKNKYNKPGNVYLAVIHRIDRPVSGVVIFAKTSKGAAKMSELIRNNEIHKTYWAISYKKPNPLSDKLVNYLFRDEKLNKSFIVNNPSDINDSSLTDDVDSFNKPTCKSANGRKIQRAELKYKFLNSSERYHLIEIELITGRHHQIRAQMSHIGCVIKGDLKYGAPRSNHDGSISLLARKVEFVHPISKKLISIISPTPQSDTLWVSFNNLPDTNS